jgi:uncharacterized membrane protein
LTSESGVKHNNQIKIIIIHIITAVMKMKTDIIAANPIGQAVIMYVKTSRSQNHKEKTGSWEPAVSHQRCEYTTCIIMYGPSWKDDVGN